MMNDASKSDPRAAIAVDIVRWESGESHGASDRLATEEPMEVRVNGASLYVTMRTPGDDFALAAGFLFGVGILSDLEDLDGIEEIPDKTDPTVRNIIAVTLDREWAPDRDRQRNFTGTSACGLCGKSSVDQVRCLASPIPHEGPFVSPALLSGLGETMRLAQHVFKHTGGLHAAALFDQSGGIVALKEDVGRHNAVDKLIGEELLANRIPLPDRIMMVSGRAGFEIVQKAAVARIPILCSISAPSSLAVHLAVSLNMTLIGFLRGDKMNVYAGSRRVQS